MKRTALALAVLGVCLEARGDDSELRERARAALGKSVEFRRASRFNATGRRSWG